MEPTPVIDARVRKTRRRLRDALVSLIHEKSHHAIVVNEILQRADVGRSAFYAHFSNKNALLTSGIDHILHRTPPRSLPPTGRPLAKVLWFSFPVLDYVGQRRQAAEAKRWIDNESPLLPQEADDVFQSLVLPTLTAAMSGDDVTTARR